MKNRKILILAFGIVVALVFGIAVAYAALSATLNAKFNSVTVGNATWNVGFRNNKDDGSYFAHSGTDGIPSDSTGIICGEASLSNNSITVDDITLSKPGDKCTYNFAVNNRGNIDAKLASIVANEPNGVTCEESESEDKYTMVCGNVTYDIFYQDHSSLHKKMLTGGENWYTMTVSYTGGTTTPVIYNNSGFTLVFAQA